MADNKKISELTELGVNDYVSADDLFVMVDESNTNGTDAGAQGKTSKVTWSKMTSSILELNIDPAASITDKQITFSNEGVLSGANVYYDLANGNVGIGAHAGDFMTPAATGYKLDANGGVMVRGFDNGGNWYGLALQNESADNSIHLRNYGGTDESKLNIGDTLFVEETADAQSGNVGIGTSSPEHPLSILGIAGHGNIEFGNGPGNADAPEGTYIQSYDRSTSTYKPLRIKTGPSEQQIYTVFDTNGNVGIGTSSPQSKLHILRSGTNPTDVDDRALILDSEPGTYKNYAGISFRVAGTEKGSMKQEATGRLYISSKHDNDHSDGHLILQQNSGNVGIGTTAPSNKLVISGSSDYDQGTLGQSADGIVPSIVIENTHPYTHSTDNGNIFGVYGFTKSGGSQNANGSFAHGCRAGMVARYDDAVSTNVDTGNIGLALDFHTAGQDAGNSQARMTIASNGNVGIGDNNPLHPLSILGIAGHGNIEFGNNPANATNSIPEGTHLQSYDRSTGAYKPFRIITGQTGSGSSAVSKQTIFDTDGNVSVSGGLIVEGGIQSSYTKFFVGGEITKYYPVRLHASEPNSTSQRFMLWRGNVHEDADINGGSTWAGTFSFECSFIPMNYGHWGGHRFHDIKYFTGSYHGSGLATPYRDPIGNFADGSTGGNNDFIIWLKGNAHYYFKSVDGSRFQHLDAEITEVGGNITSSTGDVYGPLTEQQPQITELAGGTTHAGALSASSHLGAEYNLALGVRLKLPHQTPGNAGWHSSWSNLYLGNSNFMMGSRSLDGDLNPDASGMYLVNNAYYGSSNGWHRATQDSGGAMIVLGRTNIMNWFTIPTTGAVHSSFSPTLRMSLDNVGNLEYDGVAGTMSLDARRLENVRETELNGLEKINDLKVRDFESNGETKTNVLAQELKEVVPSAVRGDDDAMEEYQVAPALGRVFVPSSEFSKPVEEASEEEIAEHLTVSTVNELGDVKTHVVIHDCEEDEHMLAEDISQDDFKQGDFHSAAVWEKTSNAVMDERIVPMSVAHSEMIPMLVKAVQELTERLEKLENSSNS